MKFNNYLFLFITLFLLKVYGYETEYTLDVVKELKLITCKSDKDCNKGYQTNCLIPEGKKEGHCITTLYCHGNNDKCVFEVVEEENENDSKDKDKKSPVVVTYEHVNTIQNEEEIQEPTLILESCNKEEASLKNCFTRKCEKNEQCFSGTCENNVCITDEKKPLYICSNDKNIFEGLSDNNNFKIDSLTCKLAEEEICKESADCVTGNCQKLEDIEDTSICTLSYSGMEKVKFIFEIFLLILFIIISFLIFKSCGKRRTHKKELKVKYEMEEIFLNQSNRNYIELEEVDDYDIDEAQKNLKNYDSFN